MLSFSFLKFYVAANVSLGMVFLLVLVMQYLNSKAKNPMRFAQQLKIVYFLLALSIIIPILCLLFKPAEFVPVTSQVWSGPSIRELIIHSNRQVNTMNIGPASFKLAFNLDRENIIANLIFFLGIAIVLGKSCVDFIKLQQVITQGFLIKKYKKINLLVSDAITVPFSFWLPGKYFIVLPNILLGQKNNFAISFQHEKAHHKNGDTKWLYFFQLLKSLFFWNPIYHLLERRIVDLQEFVCDEHLMEANKVSNTEYCNCLLNIAEIAVKHSHKYALAASIGNGISAKTLQRRIVMLLSKPRNHMHKLSIISVLVIATFMLIATAWASVSTLQDKRISMQEAQKMAENARKNTSFPITLNEQVLTQINAYLGTPDGRDYFKNSIERMQVHKILLTNYINKYSLPLELLAVPLVESAYKNRKFDGKPNHGAGFWMFIKPTALNYGLQVNEQIDERLDIAKETDAAMRYYAELNSEFSDWELNILAYNVGEKTLRNEIEKTGSRNAWDLLKNGLKTDTNYLPRVIATVILMKN